MTFGIRIYDNVAYFSLAITNAAVHAVMKSLFISEDDWNLKDAETFSSNLNKAH